MAMAAVAGAGGGPATGIRFVELGWDMPDTACLRAHAAEMERASPFDGCVLRVNGKTGDGKAASSTWGWDATPWDRASFQAAVDDLRACRFTRFTENFVRVNASPGTLDWADDAGWEAFTAKAGILAWVARAGGLRGLCVDPESYGERQFAWTPESGRNFADTAGLARRRGAQVMRAMAAEYPDMTLLGLWLASLGMNAGRAPHPEALLAGDPYGLWHAFLDGLLDAAPLEMTLVDANEHGYYLDGDAYHRVASDMRSLSGPALALVAPENRARYRAQAQVGFGFYLDMYLNEPGHRYYTGPAEGGTRLDRLRDNLAAAASAADRYVWIYGEQCRWWGPTNYTGRTLTNTVGRGRLWEEALPGVTRAIEGVRDPLGLARRDLAQMRADGTATNLVLNGDFAACGPDGRPAEFGAWQDTAAGSHGTFAWDGAVGGGSARAAGAANGCFLQGRSARSGERYRIAARALVRGTSIATLRVRWQREDGAWTLEALDVPCGFVREPGGDWDTAETVVTVPRGAGRIVLLLGVRAQRGPDDTAWFDDLELHRLP